MRSIPQLLLIRDHYRHEWSRDLWQQELQPDEDLMALTVVAVEVPIKNPLGYDDNIIGKVGI